VPAVPTAANPLIHPETAAPEGQPDNSAGGEVVRLDRFRKK
jgi:hypothetical protein